MKDEKFDKKLELREWQKMFNPSKTNSTESVLLKKQQNEPNEKKSKSSFCW
ncbi:hypothetical protein [Dickeya chrysanthemi]|uniref:hypothetical protein n=1 Tax=Dickeya chrysanthemi TaxID=556 RepID=UPI0003A1C9F3|nr:hypothetical protein [Dickeya chrysanthemi]